MLGILYYKYFGCCARVIAEENMSIKSSLSKQEKLNINDFEVFLNCDYDQVSFMILNHLEKEIIRVHGKEFISNSSDKIQYIIGFLIQKDLGGMYEMYSESFDLYINSLNQDAGQKQTFNVVFFVLVHMAIKILAENLD